MPLSGGIVMKDDLCSCKHTRERIQCDFTVFTVIQTAQEKRKKSAWKYLCFLLMDFVLVVTAILAIPVVLFLNAIGCILAATDGIVRICI